MKIGSYGFTAEKTRGKAPWTIYYNAKCSKSREALDLLRSRGVDPVVVNYQETPLSANELRELIAVLKVPAKDLLRTKEKAFSGLNISLESAEDVIHTLATHPELLERPIVVHGDRAVVARPPERALELLD